jgi:CO/xanthine dehydrogenase Mo-binding subunit
VRFLTGAGKYAHDMNLPCQTYVYIVRSPHAHARIAGIDVEPAAGAPGVLAVLTGRDATADGLQPIAAKSQFRTLPRLRQSPGPKPPFGLVDRTFRHLAAVRESSRQRSRLPLECFCNPVEAARFRREPPWRSQLAPNEG